MQIYLPYPVYISHLHNFITNGTFHKTYNYIKYLNDYKKQKKKTNSLLKINYIQKHFVFKIYTVLKLKYKRVNCEL